MGIYYTLVISDTEPLSPQPSWVWVNPATGQAYLRGSVDWAPFAVGDPVNSAIPGFYWRDIKEQGIPPSEQLGQIWLHSNTKQFYIYISGWSPFAS